MKDVKVKVTECDANNISPSMFETKKSYENFLVGFYSAVELQVLKDKGYILIDDGVPIDTKQNFVIAFDDDNGVLSMPRVGLAYDNSMLVFIGFTMGNKDNTVFVYKSELTDSFGRFSYLPPSSSTKFVMKSLTEYQAMV